MKISRFLFLAIFLSYSAFGQVTFSWQTQEISPGNNLQEMNIVNDTTTILAGYGRTFVKSADQGLTWDKIRVLNPSFDFGDMSINTNGIGYACAGDEKVMDNPTDGELDVYAEGVLLKTTDFGSTWTVFDISTIGEGDDPSLSPNAPGSYAQHFISVAVIDDITALIGVEWYQYDPPTNSKISRAGVFKTVNDGLSWKLITNNDRYPWSIEPSPSNIYFGGLNHLLKAEKGSDNVIDIYPNLTTAAASETAFVNDFTIVSEDEVYVVTSTNGIYKTVDMGATFTKLENGAPTGGNDLYIINDSVMIVLGTAGKSKFTVDRGLTWADCHPGATCYEIGGVVNDTLYGLGKSNIYKIAVSDVIGSTIKWTSEVLSEGNNLQKMHIIDANNAIIIGYGETIDVTTDAGLSWMHADLPELFVYGAKYDFSAVSTSGEASYATTRRFKQLGALTVSNTADDYYAHGLIYKSLNYWNSWEYIDVANIGEGSDPSLNPNLTGCYGLSPTEIECTNDTTLYVYVTWIDTTAGLANKLDHSRVFKSVNSGDSWVSLTEDFGYRYVNSIKFLDENTGFIVGNTILLRTDDGGATFTDLYPTVITVSGDSTIFLNDLIYVDENEWFVVGSASNGVYATYDGGKTYKKFVGVAGGSDFYWLNDISYIGLGNSTQSKLTWDKGETWMNCYPGSSIWSIGGILNDSLIALAKSNLYKIPLKDIKAINTAANILSFDLTEQTEDAVIDRTAHTVVIEVAAGTDLNALTPAITLSDGATMSPASGAAQDFTNPVTYTVTSEDGNTSQPWVVSVTRPVNTPENLVGNITLYPNPASDKLYINNLDNVNRINIISIIGESVFNANSDKNRMEINLSALEKGIYFISFYEKDGSVKTKKFIKE